MKRVTVCTVLLVAWACGSGPARGQERKGDDETIRELIRRMNERMEALEQQHESDQSLIQDLEGRIKKLEGPPASPVRGADMDEVRSEIRSEVESQLALSGPSNNTVLPMGGSSGNALNPQITAFFDLGASVSSRGRNKALNRFNLREVEMDFRAAISPSVDGVLIVSLGEEIESERNGDVSIDHAVDVEEGYLDFHTLPYDLAFKIGKFRNTFGRNNQLHTHDLPQVTRPLAVQNFLGPEGLSTTGAALSWLVPNPWDQYVEATVELVNSDGGEESPILGGPNADNPAVLGHIKLFSDLTDTSSLEIGGSYLFGRTSNDPDFDANVFGLDVAYQWTDPDPSTFRSWLLQGEAFWAHTDLDRGPFFSRRGDAFGAYAFAQYQLGQNWYVGLRGDYSEFPNSETRWSGDYDVAVSPYVSYYLSEFLRVRLQYEHRWLDYRRGSGDEDAVFLQFTGVIGSHPPHPYWVRH